MYAEDDLIPISALQHLLFCERQAALIHVERQWAENRLTVEGMLLHRKTHSETAETRGQVRTVRSLMLRSLRLGLAGQTDVVEFTPPPETAHAGPAVFRQQLSSSTRDWTGWQITPVEYKRGRPKKDSSDRVQLCAQALCLEEMLDTTIDEGALYYGRRRQRKAVVIDAVLRQQTEAAVGRMRQLLDQGITPPAIREPKCDRCSLISLCLPDATTHRRQVSRFIDNQFSRHISSTGPETD